MRALFRSLPWNSHRGRETSARTWLRRLLIVVALLLAVFSGDWIAREEFVMPLYFLAGGIGLAVFLVQPPLMLFFTPIALFYPRTIPRLLGQIGIMEGFLPLAGVVWVASVVSRRRQIRTNEVLGLALLAAMPIVGSGVTGRGDQDWVRALTWLSGCGMYLLALNLVHNRRTAEKMLFWIALAIVGVTCLDFLTHGWLPTRQEATLGDYRHTASGVGQNNFVAAVLAVVMPILVAYALLAGDYRQRQVGVIGVILGMLLGMVLLSRTFWVSTGIGLVAQVYIIWKTRGRRYVLATLLLIGGSVWLASLLTPNTLALTGEWFGAGIVSRVELSRIQLGWTARSLSLLWGHGSNLVTSRFAHAVIPTALYDYGLMFTLPLFGVLGLWLRQAIRLVRETDREDDSALSVAHLGVVASVAGTIFFNDFLITSANQGLCTLFVNGNNRITISRV